MTAAARAEGEDAEVGAEVGEAGRRGCRRDEVAVWDMEEREEEREAREET